MTEQIVAGVDFGDAKVAPHEAWLTVARVGALGAEVIDLKQVGAHGLSKALGENAAVRVVGVDCPFSVPADFAQSLAATKTRADYQSWQELAQDLIFTSMEEFVDAAKAFKKESKRFTDTQLVLPAMSPLHRGYPSMIQMTFHGIRLLAMLDPNRFFVMPFQKQIDFGCAVIEVNAEDAMNTMQLKSAGYRVPEKKEQDKSGEVRAKLLKGLVELREKKGVSFQSFPRLTMPKKFEHLVLHSDHALDSLIACYVASTYVATPSLFPDPFDSDNLDVLLEGWIYSPKLK